MTLGGEIARALLREDEKWLWDDSVIGVTTPRALQSATFFIAANIMSSLWGGEELQVRFLR